MREAVVKSALAPGMGVAAAVFDLLRQHWERAAVQRRLGTLLLAAYVGALLTIELNRNGLLPPGLAVLVPTSHYGAVALAFSLLLLLEVLSLVFVLADSIATSVGRQFQLLALILVRKAFLEFSAFGEPIEWTGVAGSIPVILADLTGALLVFVGVGLYDRVQPHRPIGADEEEQASFVAGKKLVALLLLVAFALLGLRSLHHALSGTEGAGFFEAFYTVLIFSDVLLLLLSLRYSAHPAVVFRNAGFTAATVIVRLALAAPPYVNALLGVAAVAFALGLSLAYRAFGPAGPPAPTTLLATSQQVPAPALPDG